MRNDGADAFDHVVDSLYGATLGEADWAETLAIAASYFDAPMAAITVVPADGSLPRFHMIGVDEVLTEERHRALIRSPYAIVNEVKKAGPDDRVIALPNLSDRPGFHDSIVDRDWYRIIDCEHVAGAVVAQPGRDAIWYSVARSRHDRAFDPAAMRDLNVLQRHLERALGISRTLGAKSRLGRLASGALDAMAEGVILVDAEARAEFLNESARTILSRATGIALVDGHLSATDPAEQAGLDRLLADALAGHTPDAVAVRHGATGRQLAVAATPAATDAEARSGFQIDTGRAAAVFLVEVAAAAAEPARRQG